MKISRILREALGKAIRELATAWICIGCGDPGKDAKAVDMFGRRYASVETLALVY